MSKYLETLDKAILGSKIKAARKELGYTQKDIARLAGVSQSNVSMWESGEQSIEFDKMVRLAKALDRPVDHFASNDDLPARAKTMDDLMDIIRRQESEIRELRLKTKPGLSEIERAVNADETGDLLNLLQDQVRAYESSGQKGRGVKAGD